MEAIYAIDTNNGLSQKGNIPWKSKKDLIFFFKKTNKNVVIMGRKTYFSLPKNKRPLKNRLNIVLTKTPEKLYEQYSNNIIFTDNYEIYKTIYNYKDYYKNKYTFLNDNFKIFIIGGKELYEQFIPICKHVWVTRIKKIYNCDLIFNYDFSKFNEGEVIEEDEELKIILFTKLNI